MSYLTYHIFANRMKATVPSREMLKEFLITPFENCHDIYHLERHRVDSYLFDKESESLFVSRNKVVVDWLEQRRANPTPFDTALCDWCRRHNIDYELVNYFHNVIKYCRSICPGMPSNPDKGSKILKALEDVDNSSSEYQKYLNENGFDFSHYQSDVREKSECSTYFDKKQKSHIYLSSRFPEYALAFNTILAMETSEAYGELRPAFYADFQRINAENRTTDKQRYGGVYDSRVMTQCLFCYRFHLQETKKTKETDKRTRLSKHCPDCEGRYNNWRTYIRKKHNILQSDVYIYGF
jgi:hypothetical protein